MGVCTQCGTPAAEGQRFCVVCGAALPSARPEGRSDSNASTATGSWVAAPTLEGETASTPDVVFRISADPLAQSRWSVLFRLVLALPLLVWLALLVIVTEVVTIASWFAALFTARVPIAIQRFVAGVLRYEIEVAAYVLVLVPRWPGFGLHPGDRAQVELGIPHDRLNRAAVFFRALLMIPAFVVSFFVSYATYLLAVATWISALALGRPARPLYGASALALRFTARFTAYVLLLTPTQPFAGFFGDHGRPASASSSATTGGPTTLHVASADARTGEQDAVSPTTLRSSRLSGQLILSTSARVIFIVALILGGVLGVVYQSKVVSFRNIVTRAIVVPVVEGANKNVVGDLNTFAAEAQSCAAVSRTSCISAAAGTTENSIAQQVVTLNGILGLVSRGRAPYEVYVAGVQQIDADLTSLSLSVSATQERSLLVEHLAPDIVALGQEYAQLRAAL